jgi:hypothetical protein
LHCSGEGGLFEYNSSQDTPGAVIQHDAHPPAERPMLRKRIRRPRRPESRGRWYNREVYMPDVVRPFSRNDISWSVLIISWIRDSFFFGAGAGE